MSVFVFEAWHCEKLYETLMDTRLSFDWGTPSCGKLNAWFSTERHCRPQIVLNPVNNAQAPCSTHKKREAEHWWKEAGKLEHILWRFPKLGAPPDHTMFVGFSMQFHVKPSSYCGTPVHSTHHTSNPCITNSKKTLADLIGPRPSKYLQTFGLYCVYIYIYVVKILLNMFICAVYLQVYAYNYIHIVTCHSVFNRSWRA
jgi:hypothetical protein